MQQHYKEVAENAVRWHDYTTASSAWQNLYALDKSNAPILDSIFYAFVAGRNDVAATAIGNEIVRGHLKDTSFLFSLAHLNRSVGEFKAAIEVFHMYKTLTGDELATNYDIAACYFELGDFGNTEVFLQKVLTDQTSLERLANVSGDIVPYKAAALNVAGLTKAQQNDMASGKKMIAEAIAIAPNFQLAKKNLQLLSTL